MRYFCIFILTFIILCGACNKRVPAVDYFTDVRTIVEYDSLYSDRHDPLGTIREIDVVEGTIILLNSGNAHSFFFIDADDGKFIAKWGREGRGPGEYLRIGPGFSISNAQIVFLDAMRKEINYLPISNILEGIQSDIKGIPYPYVVEFRPQYIAPVNGMKIALGAFDKGRFGVLDSGNTILDCPFDYLFDYKEIQGIFRGSVFQSEIRTNEKRNRFVITTLLSDIFEIYEITDTGIIRVHVSPFQHIPKIHESPSPRPGVSHSLDRENSIAGLMKVAVSDELICFTYSNNSYMEAVNSGQLSDEILCFDWDGRKVKKYILPFPVSNFCIDNEYIYGTAHKGDDMCIYRFKMN